MGVIAVALLEGPRAPRGELTLFMSWDTRRALVFNAVPLLHMAWGIAVMLRVAVQSFCGVASEICA